MSGTFADYVKKRKKSEEDKTLNTSTSNSTTSENGAFSDYVKKRKAAETGNSAYRENVQDFADASSQFIKSNSDYLSKSNNTYVDPLELNIREKTSSNYAKMLSETADKLRQDTGYSNENYAYQQAVDRIINEQKLGYKQIGENLAALSELPVKYPNQEAYDYAKNAQEEQSKYDSMSAQDAQDELKKYGFPYNIIGYRPGNKTDEQKANEATKDKLENIVYSKSNEEAYSTLSEDEKQILDEITKQEIDPFSYQQELAAQYPNKTSSDRSDWVSKLQEHNQYIDSAKETLSAKGYDVDSLVEYQKRLKSQEDAALKEANAITESNSNPVASSAKTVLAGLAKPTDYLQSIGAVIDNVPVNTANMRYTNYQDTVRGNVGNNIANTTNGLEISGTNVPKFLYDTGMSIADFGVTLPFGSTAALSLMGTGAAASASKDITNRGGSSRDALIGGALAGAAEVVFENISIGNLKALASKNPSSAVNVIGNILKQAGIEGSEEGFTDIANAITDQIVMGDLSQYNLNVESGLSKGLTEKEANVAAAQEFAKQVALSVIGGAISGSVTSGPAQALGHMQYSGSMTELGNEKIKSNEIDDVVSYADVVDDDVIKRAVEKFNLNASAKNAGELTTAVENSVYDQMNNADTMEELDTVYSSISDTKIKSIVDIANALYEQKSKELSESDYSGQSITKSMSQNASDSTNSDNVSRPLFKDLATNVNVRKAPAVITESNTPVEVTDIASVDELDTIVKLSDGSKVPLSSLKIESNEVQALYNIAAQFEDTTVARAYIANYDTGVPIVTYTRAYNTFYKAGMLNNSSFESVLDKNMNLTNFIKPTTLKMIYTMAVNKSVAENKAVNEVPDIVKKASGTVIDERTDTSKTTFNEVDKGIAVKTGQDVVVRDELVHDAQGYFNQKMATFFFSDNADNKYTTRIHELAEFADSWNKEGMKEVHDTILNWFSEKKGFKSLDNMIEHYQQLYKNQLGSKTYRSAAEEMVNDALGGVFATEDGVNTFLDWLKEDSEMTTVQQKSVIQTIVDFFEEIINKIKDYLSNAKMSVSASTAMQMELKNAEKIRTMFLNAIDQASINYKNAEKGNVTDSGENRYSFKEALSKFQEDYDNWNKEDTIVFNLPVTSEALKSIGVKDAKIHMDSGKIKKILEKHKGMSDSVIKKIPNVIENPILVMKSIENYADNRITLFGDVSDEKNVPVIVVLILEPGKSYKAMRIELIKIANAYGKDNNLKDFIDKSDFLYIDPNKNRTDNWLQVHGLQLPSRITDYGPIQNIAYSEKHVNISEAKDSDNLRYSLKDADSDFIYSDDFFESKTGSQSVSILEEGHKLLKDTDIVKDAPVSIARKLRTEYSSSYDIKVFSDNLEKVFAYIQNTDKTSYDDMIRIMAEVTKPVIDASEDVDKASVVMYKDFKSYIRNTKIKLSDEQKAEVGYYYGSYEKFRKSNFGTLTLSDSGTSLDSLWSEIVDNSYGYLDIDVSVNDQVLKLLDAIDGMKPVAVNNYGMDNEKASYDMALRVYEEYFKMQSSEELKKVAQKFASAKATYQKEMRSKFENRLREIKNSDRQKAKANVEDKIQKLKAAHTENRKMQAHNRKSRDNSNKYRNRIIKNSKELIDWINHPTDAKHVPDVLKETVGKFLVSIDFVSHRADEDSANTIKWLRRMDDLYKQLDQAEKQGEGYQDFFMEMDPDYLSRLSAFINTNRELTKLSLMSESSLRELDYLVRILKASVTSVNKMYQNKLYEHLSDLGNDTIMELGLKKEFKNLRFMPDAIQKLFNMDMLDSRSYFKQMGKAAFSVYEELREAFNTRVWKIKEAQDYMKKLLSDIDTKTWTGDNAVVHTVTASNGDVQMTTGQIMSLYLLQQREQAKEHIKRGGIRVGDFKTGTTPVKQVRHVHLGESALNKLFSKLTPEQIEIAKDMQKFMSENCAAWGNEVSMKQWGYTKFVEKNYFPIKTDSNNVKTDDKNTAEASLYSIRNVGFTKNTVSGANNAIVIDDIFDVFTEHVANMANYNAFSIPLSDAMKWFNYKVKEKTEDIDITNSVKEKMERAYGKEAKEYFTKLIMDINGNKQEGDISSKLIGNVKAAAVGFNLRVAIQQPASYVRAMAVIDPKYLAGAVFKKPSVKKSEEYSAISLWKSWGYFETQIGKSMKELITGQTTIIEKVKDKAMILAQLADEVTWGMLWNACELEVSDKNKDIDKDSDEFSKLVAKRFDEVIDETQVVDTVFHRSQYMKSKGGFSGVEGAFMSEPTKSYNMLRNAIIDVVENNTPESKRKLARTTVTYMVVGIVVSALAAVSDAFRDDDEYDSFMKKYENAIKDNMTSNFNPFNMVPYLKTGVSIVQGFTINRMDLGGIENLINSIKMLEKGEKKTFTIVRSFATAFSQLTGIPIGNVLREFESIYNFFSHTNLGEPEASATRQYELLYEYIAAGKTDKAKVIRADLKAAGKSDDDIDSKLKKLLAENDPRITTAAQYRLKGNTDAYVAIVREIKAEGFSQDVIAMAVNSVLNKMSQKTSTPATTSETKQESLYHKSDITAALTNGNTAMAQKIVTELYSVAIANGSEPSSAKSSIKSEITKTYKPLYIAAKGMKLDDIKVLLLEITIDGKKLYNQTDFLEWNKER